jgi:hypothetical protein
LYFGYRDDSVRAISGNFDRAFEESWIDNPQSKRLIKAIDNSEVIAGCVIKSPVLGIMPPQWLSGDVKGLITMIFYPYMDDKYYCGEVFGDNALPYILEIARTKDIYMTLVHHFK